MLCMQAMSYESVDHLCHAGRLIRIFPAKCRCELNRRPRSPELVDSDKQRLHEVLAIFPQTDSLTYEETRQVRNLLTSLPSGIDFTQEIDSEGLNLLQWLVIRNCHELLHELFWSNRYRFDVNGYRCNAPLHLACKLGHKVVVRILLKYKASLNLKSTVCYPNRSNHRLILNNCYRKVLCFACERLSPRQVTLLFDHSEVLTELLDANANKAGKDCFDVSFLFHDAARNNALNCLKLLSRRLPEQLSEKLPTGETVLSIALSKSDTCVQSLLEYSLGIEVMKELLIDCTGKSETVLHILYGEAASLDPHKMTKMVEKHLPLTCLIHRRDRERNSPLHILCRNAGRQMTHWNRRSWPQDQQDYRNKQTLTTIKYILEKGSRPDSENVKGETCLHLLFEDNMHRRMDIRPISSGISTYREVLKVLEVLLYEHPNLDVNHCAGQLSPVLNRVVRILCSLEGSDLSIVAGTIIDILQLLCKHGAKASILDEKGINILTRILTATNRWFTRTANYPIRAKESFEMSFKTINMILSTDTFSRDILKLAVKQVAIMTNISFSDHSMYSNLKLFLECIFIAGLDPNYLGITSNYNVECMPTDNVIYFLSRAFVIHGCEVNLSNFYEVFPGNMTQASCKQLKDNLSLILERYFSQNNTKAVLVAFSQPYPPPLALLCRNIVNSKLSWQLKEKVHLLPIPIQIKQYLVHPSKVNNNV